MEEIKVKPSKSKYLKKLFDPVRYKSPLKRSMSGYEIEMNIVDEQGKISYESGKLISDAKKEDKEFPIHKEFGKNMIELTAMPHVDIQKTAIYLIDNIQKTLDICEKHKLLLLPLATYPGKFKTKPWDKDRYTFQAEVLGVKKCNYYHSHCCGFHYHYTIPRGVFNHDAKFLKKPTFSRLQKSFLDSYNFLIAIDPIITALAQSSPFEGAKFYAKDSRLLFLRGGKKLNYDGLFNKHQFFGGLQPYKQTLSDMISTLNKKDQKMKTLLKKYGADKSFIKNKSKLDLVWNPVKVNQLGTLESRSMDTNYPSISLGITVAIRIILKAIQQHFYHVIPTDIGIEDPFKLEGNVIFVPPHTHVRNIWQYKSAYEGLDDAEIHKAACRLFKLANKFTSGKYKKALEPIKEIIDSKKTLSDKIIKYVKTKGYNTDEALPKDVCESIALLHAKNLHKDLDVSKKIFSGIV